MSETHRRARSEQDKRQRRNDLLSAAEGLALELGVREVTLTAVTAKVGLHPSAVRRYFESREELLLELAQAGWAHWCDVLVEELGDERELPPEGAAEIIAGSLARVPLFCDLLVHTTLSLEGAVRIERARAYKTASMESYRVICQTLAGAIAGLSDAAAPDIAVMATSTAAYLYQLSRPSETLAELYRQEPEWGHMALHFRPRLAELLTIAIRGAVTG